MTTITSIINADFVQIVKDKFARLRSDQKVIMETQPIDLFPREYLLNLPMRERIFFSYYSSKREVFPINNLNMNSVGDLQLFTMYIKMFGINSHVKNIIFEYPNFLPLLENGMFEALYTEKEEEIRTADFVSITFPFLNEDQPEVCVIEKKNAIHRYAISINNVLYKTNDNEIINIIAKTINANADYFLQKLA